MPNISPARKSAFEILFKVEKEKAFSSFLLPIYEEILDKNDRSLCHELVLGILRRQLFLDKIIERLTRKKLNKFDLEVILALRLGIYQLLFLDKIPAYSAINESVNLVKMARKRSATGLVNAVLRRASRQKSFHFEFADEIEKLSVETSHPRWLIENWIKQYELEATKKLLEANNSKPQNSFRLTRKFYRKEAEIQKEILKKLKEMGVYKSKIVEEAFILDKSNDYLLNLADQGLIYFQEEASQMVGQIVNLTENENFLDVCSAPGSKTTHLASKMNQEKSLMVAGDFYSHRINTLAINCQNQGVDFVDFVQYDAEEGLPFNEESFDVVLVDAPCSGTGTIRHNPEIRYFLKKENIRELSTKQLKILLNASKLVKRGGRLIYSTCSLEKQENEEVVDNFMVSVKAVNPSSKFIVQEGLARIFPHRDNIDGFFIVVFKKE